MIEGNNIRVPIPELSQERRIESLKLHLNILRKQKLQLEILEEMQWTK